MAVIVEEQWFTHPPPPPSLLFLNTPPRSGAPSQRLISAPYTSEFVIQVNLKLLYNRQYLSKLLIIFILSVCLGSTHKLII